jgi:hypothetical protein
MTSLCEEISAEDSLHCKQITENVIRRPGVFVKKIVTKNAHTEITTVKPKEEEKEIPSPLP